MEITSNLLSPLLFLLINLFLEYWVVQPLRNNWANKQSNPTGINKLSSKLLLVSPLYIFLCGFVFLGLTIIYFLYVYPFYQTYYQRFFYERYEFSFSGTEIYNFYDRENYVINAPKYLRTGQKAKIDIQIENKNIANEFLNQVEIQASARYTRYSSVIPFTQSEPLEITFENIAPNTTQYKSIYYTVPKNLINGDLVEFTFYRNNNQLGNGYSYSYTPRIYINTLNGFFVWLFESILFTPWVNLLLFFIAVISSLLAIVEYRPPQDSINTLSGLLFVGRIIIRVIALIILLTGISAWQLSRSSQWYMSLSLFALLTYIPFKEITNKLLPKFVQSKISKKKK